MKRFNATAVALCLLLSGCGDDPTAPSGPYSLILTTELRSATIDLSDEQPYFCDYKAIAKSEGGEKGEFAEWIGGRLDWMVGDSVAYSLPLSAAELFDRLGDVSIGRNKKQNFVRTATGTDPYDIRVFLSARHSSGEVLADSSRVGCDFPQDVMGPANLAGTWTATWVKWSSPDAIVWQYELTNSGGSLEFALAENGTFAGNSAYPDLSGDKPVVDVAGTFSVTESSSITSGEVAFAFSQGPYGTFSGTLTRSADELFFESAEGAASFDFNRDGTPEAATLEAWFVLR